jgi:O-phosphoseryl-tRNA(Cys) synthetase
VEETDPREHTLRRLQALVTRYFQHEIERDELVEEIIETLELDGYGSIEPRG